MKSLPECHPGPFPLASSISRVPGSATCSLLAAPPPTLLLLLLSPPPLFLSYCVYLFIRSLFPILLLLASFAFITLSVSSLSSFVPFLLLFCFSCLHFPSFYCHSHPLSSPSSSSSSSTPPEYSSSTSSSMVSPSFLFIT